MDLAEQKRMADSAGLMHPQLPAGSAVDRLWIVIVNYRTGALVVDCLQSLTTERVRCPEFRVVVVDNDSGDESVARIEAAIADNHWHAWARVVQSRFNGGFAFGNNIGIDLALTAKARPEYVMLLNPDTVVRPGAIAALIDFMTAHPRAGIAGSALEGADGAIDCSAHNAFSPLGELIGGSGLGALARRWPQADVSPPMRASAHECDWVSGASLIVRTQVFDEIGLLDDRYFLYFEEADFCVRAKQAGWQIWFTPSSRIVHLEGAATGIRNVVKRRPRYWYESRRRYFIKHHGITGLMFADALWAFGRVSLAVRRALRLGTGGAIADPKWHARDLLVGDLRALLDGRTWQKR